MQLPIFPSDSAASETDPIKVLTKEELIDALKKIRNMGWIPSARAEVKRLRAQIQEYEAGRSESRGWIGRCFWWEHDQETSYQTACTHDADFVNDTAREQGYRYCPWCGRRIEYKVASDD